MDFLSNITSSHEYIAPLVFGVVLLLGVIIGFINGFKTALFFLVLNIISIVATILILKYREEIINEIIPESFKIGRFKVKDLLNNGLRKIVDENPDIDGIPNDFINANKGFKGIYNTFIIIIPLLIYIFLNVFIFMPIYFVFRKKLKGKIFENKITGKSMIVSRIGGSLIGLITAFPFAVILGAISTIFGGADSNYASFISEITKIISFGEIKNVAESITNLKELINYLTD